MILTKYGLDVAVPILVVSLVMIAGAFFITSLPFKIIFIALGAAIFLFTANFFRDPERLTPPDENAVVSPADGKVVSISDVEEPVFIGGKARQVCIFMSPFDVHVNRFPSTGRVGYFRHIDGAYTVAFAEKSSEVNERTLIGLETAHGRLLFKQIAGFVARRIVCKLNVGDKAVAGERFGMIRFGSRVDVLMPPGVEVEVSIGQRVKAGETVIAHFSKPGAAKAITDSEGSTR